MWAGLYSTWGLGCQEQTFHLHLYHERTYCSRMKERAAVRLGRLRWKGVSKAKRSKFMTDLALHRERQKRLKKSSPPADSC
jgi:hypothetical protein